MRVKNEARWIERSISSILPICERVLVMDDHSDDDTAFRAASLPNVNVLESPFHGLDETRDKNWLLNMVPGNEWVLMIDGDEMLAPDAAEGILTAANGHERCLAPRIFYLWDREDQMRVDGVYGTYRRPSVFRAGGHKFQATMGGPNFHCGNAPSALQRMATSLDVGLLHFGYMNREDRVRKYNWYHALDGQNPNEDGYRHMVIGDLFPATSVFRHGGPLELKALTNGASVH